MEKFFDAEAKSEKSDNATVELANKLLDTVGWVTGKESPKTIGRQTLIEEIQKMDIDPLTKAALISHVNQIIKKYSNQCDIVKTALQLMDTNARPKDVEDDWLMKYMDKAGNVSSQDFQLIWAKVLARECNDPGEIPAALLSILEDMDREDAVAFQKLCNISVELENEHAPIIIGSRLDEYRSLMGISYDNIKDLEALGLIEERLEFDDVELVAEAQPANAHYFDHIYELNESNALKIGSVSYTKCGEVLFRFMEAEEVEGFWENYCIPFWKATKCG